MSASETDYLTHDHYFLSRSHDDSARRTLWVVGLTAVMMVGEIIAGLVYGSMALLADGFHMATHAGALAVAAGAYAYAKRHAANRRFSFGTGKVGDLAGFASALVLGIVALGIAGESIGRLIDPRSVAFGQATLVAILGLVVNLVSAVLLSGGGHHHGRHGHGHGHHHDHDHHDDHDHQHGHGGHRDNNLRAAYIHVLADALTSVLAIIALLAGRYGMGLARPADGHRRRDRHRPVVVVPDARHRRGAARHNGHRHRGRGPRIRRGAGRRARVAGTRTARLKPCASARPG